VTHLLASGSSSLEHFWHGTFANFPDAFATTAVDKTSTDQQRKVLI